MKNLENFGVSEIETIELVTIEGGWIFGTSGFNWGNFMRGVGIGAGSGAAGAAAYYMA
jgi:hypothetical protein